MPAKPAMLPTILFVWIWAVVTCTALALMHTVAALESLGGFAPFFAAMIVGYAVSVPMFIAIRRIFSIDKPASNIWAVLSIGPAAYLGVLSWGLPVGLVFALEWILRFKDLTIVIPGIVMWPLGGAAFGVLMRWIAIRGERHRSS